MRGEFVDGLNGSVVGLECDNVGGSRHAVLGEREEGEQHLVIFDENLRSFRRSCPALPFPQPFIDATVCLAVAHEIAKEKPIVSQRFSAVDVWKEAGQALTVPVRSLGHLLGYLLSSGRAVSVSAVWTCSLEAERRETNNLFPRPAPRY